jgi:hypothetical protein
MKVGGLPFVTVFVNGKNVADWNLLGAKTDGMSLLRTMAEKAIHL